MSAVAGLRGTGDMGTDERPKNFREMIMFRNPKGSAPIFALTARAKKRTVDDPDYSWWDEPNDIVRLLVNGALTAGATVVTVDSADPTASTPGARWGVASHLKEGDLLLVEPSTDSTTFDHEIIEVASVQSDTQFTVKRGAGGTTAAAIGDNANLTLIGSVYAEGTGAPSSVSRNPIKYNNLTQIFKNTYELTGTVDQTNMRTGNPWSNDKKRKVFDHARDIEMSILWGRKHETTGENGKPKRFMGGIREQIAASNVNVWGAAPSVNGFLDFAYPVFDFDSAAGDERIAFCGNGALNVLNKTIHADSNSDITFEGVVNVFGMNLQRFVMPQGSLYLRTHPLLNRHPLYTYSMFILDFSQIGYVALRNRDTKVKDDVQNKDEDVRRGYIQTECSLEVGMGGLTCAYIGNWQQT